MSNQRYSPEFKDEAVRQIVDRGYSVAEVSERLGVRFAWGFEAFGAVGVPWARVAAPPRQRHPAGLRDPQLIALNAYVLRDREGVIAHARLELRKPAAMLKRPLPGIGLALERVANGSVGELPQPPPVRLGA